MESPEQTRHPAAQAPPLHSVVSKRPSLEGSGFHRLSLMVHTIFGLLVAVDAPGAAQSRPRGTGRPAA
ncbi:MAG: hypothetical protein FJW90_00880 [Actinobacteria bacterium]|nr:hypothetical protein [Actinomycetota bacterium]